MRAKKLRTKVVGLVAAVMVVGAPLGPMSRFSTS